jgi:hypothetical protein
LIVYRIAPPIAAELLIKILLINSGLEFSSIIEPPDVAAVLSINSQFFIFELFMDSRINKTPPEIPLFDLNILSEIMK